MKFDPKGALIALAILVVAVGGWALVALPMKTLTIKVELPPTAQPASQSR